jgi:hypothetical protein
MLWHTGAWLAQSANLRVFEDQALENEVLGLIAVQTPSGWKVDHKAGGYSDRAIAIGMALAEAVKYRMKPGSENFWQREQLRSSALSQGNYEQSCLNRQTIALERHGSVASSGLSSASSPTPALTSVLEVGCRG